MLARNPEVQEKLYDDIIEKLDEHVGLNVTYLKPLVEVDPFHWVRPNKCFICREKLVMKWYSISRTSTTWSTKFSAWIRRHSGIKWILLTVFCIIKSSVNTITIFYSRVERECNKDVTYNNIKIKKGTVVTVPAFALHYDADYYPEPEVFNPDR